MFPIRHLSTTTTKIIRDFHSIPQLHSVAIEDFRNAFFKTGRPVLIKGQFGTASTLPAVSKWFTKTDGGVTQLNEEYWQPYRDMVVALEKTGGEANGSDGVSGEFESFEAPFSLFQDWLSHSPSQPPSQPPSSSPSSSLSLSQSPTPSSLRLYLAQTPITSLPSSLQSSLPTPSLVSKTGKGDVYASSIWLGLSPTLTPMHKDPNPNLLVQMVGCKKVRMVDGVTGRGVLGLARGMLQKGGGLGGLGGMGGMRGEEMMGEEGRVTDGLLWGEGDDIDFREVSGHKDTRGPNARIKGFRATLHPGDGLFIPQGWWHSVRGTGTGLNASVNWWFR